MNGSRVCVADWVVDLSTCAENSPGYTKLSTEQQRRFDITVSTLSASAESVVDFSSAWEAEFAERPPDTIRDLVAACIERTEPDRAGNEGRKALIATGGALLGVSAVSAVVMGVGISMVNQAEEDFAEGPTLEQRAAADRKGERGQTLAITGAVAAAVLVPVGITLIVVGRTKSNSQYSLTPSVGPEFAGLTIQGRF